MLSSDEGRGVVAAANYAARRFDVHSAMPAATALRLCPHAVVLRPRMEYYTELSDQIRDILHRYTPLVEPLSLDEAFLDVAGSEALFGPAADIGRRIKQEIRDELRLTASVGVAPNKFLTKIASEVETANTRRVSQIFRERLLIPPRSTQSVTESPRRPRRRALRHSWRKWTRGRALCQ
jgi:DNA polymerase-4